jgi:hypothetical protein
MLENSVKNLPTATLRTDYLRSSWKETVGEAPYPFILLAKQDKKVYLTS